MRHIAESFTEQEWEPLQAGKGDRTWREAIIDELAVEPEGVEGRG